MNGYDDDDEGKEGPNHEATEDPREEMIERARLQKMWEARLDQADKDMKDFWDDAKRSLKWLRLDKQSRRKQAKAGRLNIAWSNYEVMRSTIYSRPPQVVIGPKYGGGPNRAALIELSEVTERAVQTQNEAAQLHSALCLIRDHLLQAGRGIGWVRYEADFEDTQIATVDPMTGTEIMIDAQIKADERIRYDVVSWRNFRHGRADRWQNVRWVAREERMTKKELMKRFKLDEAAIQALQISFGGDAGEKSNEPQNVDGDTVAVHEAWCKDSRKVYFIVKGASMLVEPPSEPLIDVDGFFPCPEPAASVLEADTILPIPDVIMIEDQLQAIDDLAARIKALEKSLKVRGFYSKGATDTSAAAAIEKAVTLDDDRQILIPVTAWAAGGQSKLDIVWLPIDTVVQTISTLNDQLDRQIEMTRQVSGISDVMRGESQASETLGAQQLKDRWGNVRVRDKQEEMRRVARDLCRIAAEAMCELFDPEHFEQAAVYGFKPEMMDVLRDDKLRSMVLDIETDSTVQADEQEDKQRRTEFTAAVGGILKEAMPLVQAMPQSADFIGAMLKFNVRGFRAGREVEKDLDAFIEAMKAKAATPPAPPPPDPAAQAKTQAEIAKAQASVETSRMGVQKAAIDLQKASLPPPMPEPIPLN